MRASTSRAPQRWNSSGPACNSEDARACATLERRGLALLGLLALLGPLGLLSFPARAAALPRHASLRQPGSLPQQDPQLRAVVGAAIQQAQCFADRFDSAVWYTLMEPKLRSLVPDPKERLQILQTVYCETHRPDASPLPPGLIMAMLEVESRFNRWAVSGAGAVGLMQVMPFWPEQLGMHRYQLVRVVPNIHMGCAILRYYLQVEHHDIRRALERYNGSYGRRNYPDRVIRRWTTYWNGADGLGRTLAHNTVSAR